MLTLRLWLGVFAFFGWVSFAHADGMRCGEWLVDKGMTTGEVALRCGPPTLQEHREAIRDADGNVTSLAIDTWTYNFGPQSFIRILGFVNGRLRGIDVGGYGK
jgi:hypothetical protein